MTTEADGAGRSRSGPAEIVETIFREYQAEQRIPGVAFGVVQNGLVHVGRSGLANVAMRRPVSDDTIFRIASMTKSITASCVLMLRDDGLLRLDDEVASYLPHVESFERYSADSPDLTIRHLLTMSGGLVEDDPWADRQLSMEGADFERLLRSSIPFDRAPATEFEYSNLGYAVLGRVVEVVSRSPLPELARERLFDPLGMTSTAFDAEGLPPSRLAQGYRLSGDAWQAEVPLGHGAFGAMGGVWTSIPDFAKYVACHLSAWPPRDEPERMPIRRSTSREMQQPQRLVTTGRAPRSGISAMGYGMGLMGGRHQTQGRVVAHSGGLPGFGSHVEWLPDCGVAVIAFGNLTYAPMRVAVGMALDALDEAGLLTVRALPPNPDLLSAQQLVTQLYQQWTDGLILSMAADNLLLDRDLAARRGDFAELRMAVGASLVVGPLLPDGRLRGRWKTTCERGVLNCEVWLSPTTPSRIQMLRMELAPPGLEQ